MSTAARRKAVQSIAVVITATALLATMPAAAATSAGKWQRAADLLHPRVAATATTLADGRVLVAGGRDGTYQCVLLAPCDTTASVEIFDPHAGRWSTAAPMGRARAEHTAVLLRDGRVLVAAGRDTNGCGGHCEIGSVEVYDPARNSWSLTSAHAYAGGTATVLTDGRVLLAGGEATRGITTDEAGIYDPRNDTWVGAARMPVSRAGHSAALLPSGKVLVVAGSGNCCAVQASELYDPVNDIWTEAAPILAEAGGAVGVLLGNGRLLATGATTGASFLYDPASAKWSQTGVMAAPRSNSHATLLPDGRVLVSGGGIAESELYDPSAGSWSRGPKAKVARTTSAAAALPSGAVLEIGGSGGSPAEVLSSVEIYR